MEGKRNEHGEERVRGWRERQTLSFLSSREGLGGCVGADTQSGWTAYAGQIGTLGQVCLGTMFIFVVVSRQFLCIALAALKLAVRPS